MANRPDGSAALEAELAGIAGLAAACGFTVEPQWIQRATPSAGCYNRQLGRLLVQGAPGERPDGLVITDDNLVPDLTAGLAESGVKDVVVVAHTNFPHPTPSAVPVSRLGYDIRKLVALCMERIDQQRNGQTAAAVTVLPAMWEEEIGAARAPVVRSQNSEVGRWNWRFPDWSRRQPNRSRTRNRIRCR
jgi:DNA-binding LacI/PurR family transcriptional regulator